MAEEGRQVRIAVIGAGNVGGTLGRLWARAGHEVTFAVRDPGATRARPRRPATRPHRFGRGGGGAGRGGGPGNAVGRGRGGAAARP
ncbi:MAG: NAD(P)-binding domain-containing protein [Dehalococcoidia bacterium]